MSRIIHINLSKSNQNGEQSLSQQSQTGLNKFKEFTQTIQVFNKNAIPPTSEKKQSFECRICLQTEEEVSQPFIEPCHCTGSVKYVHGCCFTQWVRTTLVSKTNRQLNKIAKNGMQCDLCKMRFQVKISFEKICTNMQKLKQKIRYHRCQFTTFFVMLIISLILLCVTISMVPSDIFGINLDQKEGQLGNGSSGKQAWQKVVLLCSLAILIIILLLISYLLISEYGFSYRTQFGYKGKQLKTLKEIISE